MSRDYFYLGDLGVFLYLDEVSLIPQSTSSLALSSGIPRMKPTGWLPTCCLAGTTTWRNTSCFKKGPGLRPGGGGQKVCKRGPQKLQCQKKQQEKCNKGHILQALDRIAPPRPEKKIYDTRKAVRHLPLPISLMASIRDGDPRPKGCGPWRGERVLEGRPRF